MLFQVLVDSADYKQYLVGLYGKYRITLIGIQLAYNNNNNDAHRLILLLKSNKILVPYGSSHYLQIDTSENSNHFYHHSPLVDCVIDGYIDFELSYTKLYAPAHVVDFATNFKWLLLTFEATKID
jgi:hypothetical protein